MSHISFTKNYTTVIVVLRDLHLHFQGLTFSCHTFAIKKNAQATDIPGRFAAIRSASAVELLLFFCRHNWQLCFACFHPWRVLLSILFTLIFIDLKIYRHSRLSIANGMVSHVGHAYMVATPRWWPRLRGDHAYVLATPTWWPRLCGGHVYVVATPTWWPRLRDNIVSFYSFSKSVFFWNNVFRKIFIQWDQSTVAVSVSGLLDFLHLFACIQCMQAPACSAFVRLHAVHCANYSSLVSSGTVVMMFSWMF